MEEINVFMLHERFCRGVVLSTSCTYTKFKIELKVS